MDDNDNVHCAYFAKPISIINNVMLYISQYKRLIIFAAFITVKKQKRLVRCLQPYKVMSGE